MDLDDIQDLLSRETQIIIYRFFQESFTNVAMHAGATKVAAYIRKQVRMRFPHAIGLLCQLT